MFDMGSINMLNTETVASLFDFSKFDKNVFDINVKDIFDSFKSITGIDFFGLFAEPNKFLK